MITQAKDILQQVIEQRITGVTIARSFQKEKKACLAKQWPLVSLITNPGRFENASRITKYFDKDAKIWKQRYVRGKRILPVLMRCWAMGEDSADELFSSILPYVPTRWVLDDIEGEVSILSEEHSDHAGNTSELYVSAVEIEFSMEVARVPGDLPTINTVNMEPGEIK